MISSASMASGQQRRHTAPWLFSAQCNGMERKANIFLARSMPTLSLPPKPCKEEEDEQEGSDEQDSSRGIKLTKRAACRDVRMHRPPVVVTM